MNLKDTYNLIAQDYYQEHLKIDRWSRKDAKEYAKLFKKGSLILDVGCGPGVKSRDFYNEGLKVLGIDFSEQMIQIAKKVAPACDFKVLDIKEIDKLSGKFDGIFVQAVLFHFPKKEVPLILKKLYSKLREGGYFYLAVKKMKSDRVEEKVKIESDYGYSYKRFFSYFTTQEIKDYLNDLGLKIIKDNSRIMRNKIGDKNWIVFIAQK